MNPARRLATTLVSVSVSQHLAAGVVRQAADLHTSNLKISTELVNSTFGTKLMHPTSFNIVVIAFVGER